ncbi:SCP-like protein [Ancylostoma ceylanicum]|uniref:Histone H4 n=2 Tax=Ancylostoma ceylanicum TaxID=53326 RepID=A0A0D6M169_9BILA|nr:SCP-like protein [Ancylostoma ceylanicum]
MEKDEELHFLEDKLRMQRVRFALMIIASVAVQRSMALVADELERVELLTHGLEEWVEEGSGLSDEDQQRGPNPLIPVDRYSDSCANSVMTLKHRNYILYNHNRLRSKLAQGRQPNKEGMMGSGKNIYLLKWDCDLERMARRWSQACPSFPMAYTRNPSGSQLVKEFDMNWQGINATQHIDDAMRSWWLEYKKNGNVDFKNRYSSAQNYYGWANMAKGKTTRIGCSYWICDLQRAIFTCVYNAKCIPSLGLCQGPDIPEDRTKNEMCGGVEASMTDYARTTVLELHNFYRSRLARGLEFNGEINTTQPGARNMIKLEYDCRLEKYAQEWADKCTFEHSNSWERPNQGQNLYMTTIRNWETTSLLHTAMEIWWRELEEHGMPADAILSESVWDQKGRLIGHFTQMTAISGPSGKGLGKCASKRHKKYRSEPIQGITKPAIRRLARRAGVKRISGLIYAETRDVLRTFLSCVIRDAVTYCEHAKRNTVTAMDVVYALKRQGRTLYGFGG